MFILTKIADLVQISPEDFRKNSLVAIEDNINTKYANKVIQKIGLGICLYDILWTSEGLIGHGTGLVNVNTEFRLVVFRPFKGETIMARILSAVPSGVWLRTDFFDNIFVPMTEMPEGAHYNHNDQLWLWGIEDQEVYYDIHEMVRVTVIDEQWIDQRPEKPPLPGQEPPEKEAPYTVIGTMKGAGLGVTMWWD